MATLVCSKAGAWWFPVEDFSTTEKSQKLKADATLCAHDDTQLYSAGDKLE